ncbi:hypothetical protein H2200_012184 [Cladophialophora chaetospira]|uniref:Uncharacterized protein n=1 Tax=Cladophialophora chaetospira TaxID=386627 RepID=A0AA38WYF7_9EURO|nr:hypothetical protein H2200_012184 [Cladophialophora chaetospira]
MQRGCIPAKNIHPPVRLLDLSNAAIDVREEAALKEIRIEGVDVENMRELVNAFVESARAWLTVDWSLSFAFSWFMGCTVRVYLFKIQHYNSSSMTMTGSQISGKESAGSNTDFTEEKDKRESSPSSTSSAGIGKGGNPDSNEAKDSDPAKPHIVRGRDSRLRTFLQSRKAVTRPTFSRSKHEPSSKPKSKSRLEKLKALSLNLQSATQPVDWKDNTKEGRKLRQATRTRCWMDQCGTRATREVRELSTISEADEL